MPVNGWSIQWVKYSTVGHHSAMKKDRTADMQQQGWMSSVLGNERGRSQIPLHSTGKAGTSNELGVEVSRRWQEWGLCDRGQPLHPDCHAAYTHLHTPRVHTDVLTLLLYPSRVTCGIDGNRARLHSEPSLQLPVSLRKSNWKVIYQEHWKIENYKFRINLYLTYDCLQLVYVYVYACSCRRETCPLYCFLMYF